MIGNPLFSSTSRIMSNDQPAANEKPSVGVKNIVRIIVGVIAVAALATAGLDYMQKKQFEDSQTALAEILEDADGVAVAELGSVIVGSPTVTGDPQTDSSVTYSWGLIRKYEFEVRIESGTKRRDVVSFE